MTVAAIYDIPAPAKLNLFLHVVGRRDDGLGHDVRRHRPHPSHT